MFLAASNYFLRGKELLQVTFLQRADARLTKSSDQSKPEGVRGVSKFGPETLAGEIRLATRLSQDPEPLVHLKVRTRLGLEHSPLEMIHIF